MLSLTPDGKTMLVANDGEPSDDYQIDPEGSVSVIDISKPEAPLARSADFRAYNGREARLRPNGVRIFGSKASAAQDPEPECIAVAPDGRTAWVSLQENNALATVDIAAARVTGIDYLNTREDWTTKDPSTVGAAAGDLGPEGLAFIPAAQSPSGEPLLLVGNEISGTTSVLRLNLAY
jgi:DNA-binding beta-propeller fold protein YncE